MTSCSSNWWFLTMGAFTYFRILLQVTKLTLIQAYKFKKYLYYMHNEEIWRFLNKLKAIITSGLEDLFPLRKYFLLAGSTFPMQTREYLSHVDVSFWRQVIMTSIVCQQRSECKTLDSEKPLKWRSHEHNNFMRSKCLCCTLTFLVVLSR